MGVLVDTPQGLAVLGKISIEERGNRCDTTGFSEVAVNYSDRVNCNWFIKIHPSICLVRQACHFFVYLQRIEDQRFHNGHQHDQGYGPGEQLVGLQITVSRKWRCRYFGPQQFSYGDSRMSHTQENRL